MAKNYKILHMLVGPFPQGRVVSEKQLKYSEGVDVQRLLDLEAIEETDEDVTEERLPANPEHVTLDGPEPGEPTESDADLDEDDEPRRNVRKLPGGRVADMHGSDRPTVGGFRKNQVKDLSRTGTREVGDDDDNLDRKTVEQLREIAKDRGVEDYESMKKAQLIRAIKKADKASDSEE